MAPLTVDAGLLMTGTVAIIGGGMAGLTAALELSSHGFAVTVLEETDRLGGRLADQSLTFLFGCYTATWGLLDKLQMTPMLQRSKHTPLEFLRPDGTRAHYASPPLPSPLNALIGTTLFRGLSMRDRWQLLAFLERTWERDPPLPDDLESRTADRWLASIGQSEEARRDVWNPLSRLLLSGELARVSAFLFMRTLRRSFFTGASVGRLTVPSADFPSRLVMCLVQRLQEQRVSLRSRAPVRAFRYAHDRVSSIELDGGEKIVADYYVAALPIAQFSRLLSERLMTNYAYFQQIGRLQSGSQLALYIELIHPSPSSAVVLLPRGFFHWIIAGAIAEDQEDKTAVTLVAAGDIQSLSASDKTVVDRARSDLAAVSPTLAAAPWISHRIIRMPDSVLAVTPGTAQYRPLQRSPLPNLVLAGDWTDTGWPANLEGAVASGERCAASIVS